MSPYLRSETPIPSRDDCAACSGTRQDYPEARANTARGLDGTRRKPEPHIPYKREWDLLESATGDISIGVKKGTFLTRHDKPPDHPLTADFLSSTLSAVSRVDFDIRLPDSREEPSHAECLGGIQIPCRLVLSSCRCRARDPERHSGP